jgi:hypothetical protein
MLQGSRLYPLCIASFAAAHQNNGWHVGMLYHGLQSAWRAHRAPRRIQSVCRWYSAVGGRVKLQMVCLQARVWWNHALVGWWMPISGHRSKDTCRRCFEKPSQHYGNFQELRGGCLRRILMLVILAFQCTDSLTHKSHLCEKLGNDAMNPQLPTKQQRWMWQISGIKLTEEQETRCCGKTLFTLWIRGLNSEKREICLISRTEMIS